MIASKDSSVEKSLKDRFRLISFDLDNALYDNSPILAKAETCLTDYLADQFLRQNKSFVLDDYLQIKQSLLASKDERFENLSVLRQTLLNRTCSGLANSKEIAIKAFDLFIEKRSQANIPPEIDQMLASLSKQYILVSVTNGNCDIKALSIARHFSKNYSTTLNYRAKPHPEMLLQVLTDFNLPSAQLLHVGDSIEKDGGAAKNAQVAFFHFAPFDKQANIQRQCDSLLQYLHAKTASTTG